MTTMTTEWDEVTTAYAAALRTVSHGVIAATVRAVSDRVERETGGNVYADAARADATADALRMLARGVPQRDAVTMAVRDAVRDTRRAAARDDLRTIAFDTTDRSALDTVDNARLSHHDDQRGGYRGVARVPVPTDALRPADMPTPEEIGAAAWDAMADDHADVLRRTLAVNLAAESQRHAERDAVRAVVADVARDVDSLTRGGRHGRAFAARKTLADARRALDAHNRRERAIRTGEENPWRTRTADVAASYGVTSRGRASQRVGTQQAQAWAAWHGHASAIVAAALARHADDMSDDAHEMRRRYDARASHPLTVHAHPWRTAEPRRRIGTAVRLAARLVRTAHAERDAVRADALASLPTRIATPASDGVGGSGRYTSSNGQGTAIVRPRRAAWEWDRPLPGPGTHKPAALAALTDTRNDPERSRSHGDDAAPAAPVAPTVPTVLSLTIPGPSAPMPTATAILAPPLVDPRRTWVGVRCGCHRHPGDRPCAIHVPTHPSDDPEGE